MGVLVFRSLYKVLLKVATTGHISLVTGHFWDRWQLFPRMVALGLCEALLRF